MQLKWIGGCRTLLLGCAAAYASTNPAHHTIKLSIAPSPPPKWFRCAGRSRTGGCLRSRRWAGTVPRFAGRPASVHKQLRHVTVRAGTGQRTCCTVVDGDGGDGPHVAGREGRAGRRRRGAPHTAAHARGKNELWAHSQPSPQRIEERCREGARARARRWSRQEPQRSVLGCRAHTGPACAAHRPTRGILPDK